MFKLNRYCFIHVVIGISVYGAIALSFAYMLDTNYCDLLVCSIDFVDKWRQNLGQVLYVVGVYLFGVGLECLVCGVKLLVQRFTIKNRGRLD